jgi:Na+-translocating ferredoxin:NAD+ oxidoreductase subunit C
MNIRLPIEHMMAHIPLLQVPAGSEIVSSPETVTQLLPVNTECSVVAGDALTIGSPLCRRPAYGSFASVTGVVRRVMPWNGGPRGGFVAVVIARGATGKHYQLFDPVVDPTAFSPELLRERCAQCGFHFSDDGRPLLFSALDEDVDRVTNRWCAEKQFDRIVSGMKMLRHLYGNREIVIALPASLPEEKRVRCAPFGKVIAVPCQYPDTVSTLIVRRHPAFKAAAKVAVIDAKRLLALVTSLSTGRAETTMMVSLRIGRKGQVRLYQVPMGMSVGQLMSGCCVAITDGMQIIIGGEMTGAAVDNNTQPLTPENDSVLILPRHEVVMSENTPCVNCGRCLNVCPVKLRVDLIGKSVEFSRGNEAARLGIDQCIDCGLCSAACIVRRPLAHLLAFGKGAFIQPKKNSGVVV